jgi:hypothetical protein
MSRASLAQGLGLGVRWKSPVVYPTVYAGFRSPRRAWLILWVFLAGLVVVAWFVTSEAAQAATSPPGGRQYVVATYDGSLMRLYVNGSEIARKTLGVPPSQAATKIEIGAFLGGSNWNGTLDDVALYKRPLSAATVKRHYRLGTDGRGRYASSVRRDPAIVAYWRLDDRTGTEAADLVGSHSGEYGQGVGLGANGLISGDPDGAIDLNGAQGEVLAPDTGLRRMTSFTLEAWVTARAIGNSHILSKAGSWFLKVNLDGSWGAGIVSGGKLLGLQSRQHVVTSDTPAIAPPPPSSKSPAAPTGAASKGSGGGSNAAVVLAVLVVLALAGLLVLRGRREGDSGDEEDDAATSAEDRDEGAEEPEPEDAPSTPTPHRG